MVGIGVVGGKGKGQQGEWVVRMEGGRVEGKVRSRERMKGKGKSAQEKVGSHESGERNFCS